MVISVIFGCQESLTTNSLLQETGRILHNTAVTKQWTSKWPYIANAVFRIVKIMVKKVIYVRFKGAIAPITPTWIRPCIMGALHTELKQTVLNSWYNKTISVSRGVKTVICPLWKLGLRTKIF